VQQRSRADFPCENFRAGAHILEVSPFNPPLPQSKRVLAATVRLTLFQAPFRGWSPGSLWGAVEKAQRQYQETEEKQRLFTSFSYQAESWDRPRWIIAKVEIKADRLSCHRFLANQFRLLLHTAAYCLFWLLRHHLQGTELATAQVNTLRLKLLKIGARIRETSRRIWVHLASGYPHRDLLAGLLHNLRASPA